MAVKYTNNAKSTLASGINSSVTSATVADGSIFPALGAGEYFYITFDDGSNNEIAKVTARSGNTLTIVRAQDNTTARAFSTGDSAELRIIAAVLTEIQENIAAKSANQTVYSATAASNATAYNIGVDPGVEANASVFLDGVYQHHDTFSFSGSTLTFDAAPTNGTKIEVVVDNLINLQSSNLTVDTFTATSGQTAFTLSDAPGGEANVLAFIDGVFQNQAAFTLSSNTLTFDTGVVVGRSVTVYTINPVNIGTPSDSTVTSAKLTGNITLPGSLTVGAYDVAFDSPTFFVDHTNSRVGLGTSSPSVPVDIVGEVKTSSHINIGGNLVKASGDLTLDVAGDIVLDAGGQNWYFDDDGTRVFSIAQVSSDVYIGTEVSDKDMIFRVNDGGSVITALTLDGSDAGSATFNSTISSGAITSTGTSTFSDITIGATGDSQALIQMLANSTNGANTIHFGDAASGTSLYTGYINYAHDTNQMQFATNGGSVRLVIDSKGNAGIGTTPSTGWVNSTDFAVLQIGSGLALWGRGSGDHERLGLTANIYHDGSAYRHMFTGRITSYEQNDGKHLFKYHASQSAGSSVTPTTAMTIDTSGKVGIGETTPDDTLHVNASGGVARLRIGSGTDTYYTTKGYLGDTWYFGSSETTDVVTSTISGGAFTSSNAGGAFVWKTDNGGTLSEKLRLKSSGALQLQSYASTSNRKEEVFHTKSVGTSYTDFFSVDIASAHRAVFYEIITFGGDWSGHSAARSYYKGFMSGTTSYSGDGEIENAGTYGSGSHIDWNYTRSGSTVTFQVKLYTGSVALEAYIRVIGTFGDITLL